MSIIEHIEELRAEIAHGLLSKGERAKAERELEAALRAWTAEQGDDHALAA